MAHARGPRLERFWRSTLVQWRKSGLSVRDFCRRRQLSEPSFYAWRRELAKREQSRTAALAFVPVQVCAEPLPGVGPGEAIVEVVLPDGLVVRARSAVEAATVARLVAALRATSC
jgi:hypothetical protein